MFFAKYQSPAAFADMNASGLKISTRSRCSSRALLKTNNLLALNRGRNWLIRYIYAETVHNLQYWFWRHHSINQLIKSRLLA